MKSVLSAAIAAASLLGPVDARADGEKPHRIEWVYPKFRAAEVALTLGVFATTTWVEYRSQQLGDYSPNSGWQSGFLFDDAARDLFRARSYEGRHLAAGLSNTLWQFTSYYPTIGDALITPLLFDRFNTNAALQMMLINWESTTIAWLFVRIGHRAIGRDRPSVQECAKNPQYDDVCTDTTGYPRASFPGGHAGMAFTSAGLVCSQHAALPLYGGNGWDKAACALAMTTATATTLLRAVADRHWATDLMVGAGIGLGAGLALPYLLHFAPHHRDKKRMIAILPAVYGLSGGGLTIAGFE